MKLRKIDPTSLSLYVLMLLLLFQGISGLYGGISLIIDPYGDILQMSPDLLKGTGFDTFLVPGILLFTVLGTFPLIVLIGLWKLQRWAWIGALLVGFALIIWILVEMLMIGYIYRPPLQAIYGCLGVVILILVLFGHIRGKKEETSV